jgi:CHAD domain-containing protein
MTTPWRATFAKALRKGTLAPVFTTDVQRTSLPLAFARRHDGDARDRPRRDRRARPACARRRRAHRRARARARERRREPPASSWRRASRPTCPSRSSRAGKAERGYAIVDRGRRPSRRARRTIEHDDDATAAKALASVVAECVRQIAANTLGFRGRRLDDAEWVHQMRIGVAAPALLPRARRRHRAAAALDDLRAQTRWVLDALGPARDLDVFADQTLPAVLADLDARGSDALGVGRQLERGAKRRRRSADDAALACVSSPRFTRFVLAADGVAGALAIATGGEAHDRARKFAARIIDKRARRLAKAGAHLAHASVEARHATRIAAKKLRYATEFFATLFPRRRTKAYRDALASCRTRSARSTTRRVAIARRRRARRADGAGDRRDRGVVGRAHRGLRRGDRHGVGALREGARVLDAR